MSDIWYAKVNAEERLTQGDIILDCPLVGWKAAPVERGAADPNGGPQTTEPSEAPRADDPTETLKTFVEYSVNDVIVMTQACDLKQEKVQTVILCPHIGLDGYRPVWEAEMKAKDQKVTTKHWERHTDDICQGFIPNLSLINAGADGELQTDIRVVAFHELYSLPRIFLESLLKQRGQPRLRLLPPYREHLSQAFARFFMRVGLPVDIKL